MDALTAIFIAFVALLVMFGFYVYFSQPSVSNTIRGSIADGRKTFNSNEVLSPSFNQKQGMTFSYTCWIKIDDFSYRYGEQKVIFTKGPTDLSSSCPALLIDANTNSLLVKLDTYGATEIIPISNIPAKKWMHVAIVVDQDSVDVYINGLIHTHHTLAQLPRQNTDSVHSGIGGGFDGKIAQLEYYGYFLTPQDVANSMKSTPAPDSSDVGQLPPYFDLSWWTKRS